MILESNLKDILESMEIRYDLQKGSLAKSVFPPELIKSVCRLTRLDDSFDGNDFYMTIYPRKSELHNTVYMIFKGTENWYYGSTHYYESKCCILHKTIEEELSEISRTIKKFNPVKIAIPKTAEYYFQRLEQEYPSIKFIPIEITEISKQKMMKKLISFFEDEKILLCDLLDAFLSFFETENGYIPSLYENCIWATAFLTELI